jgi:glycosyltransferase involved in cell wall biosynthesis
VPEGFGLVAVEAAAAGVPVVASRLGALPEIVSDGETGLLVRPGDADALADALRRLLDDRELRARFGMAARLRARRFAPDVATAQIEGLYRSLLEAA